MIVESGSNSDFKLLHMHMQITCYNYKTKPEMQ